MKFDRRIVGLYGLMMIVWAGYGVFNVIHHCWPMLAICLAMIGISCWMAYPSMLTLVKKEAQK